MAPYYYTNPYRDYMHGPAMTANPYSTWEHWKDPEWPMWGSQFQNAQGTYPRYGTKPASELMPIGMGLRGSEIHWGDPSRTLLPEEPELILVVNSSSSGAYSSLCVDAASADLVALDVEWTPDLSKDSDNPISVMQLAFPASKRVYVLQLDRLDGKLPTAVQMMLVNPGVTKVGFAVDSGDVAKLATSRIAVTRGSIVDAQDESMRAMGVTRPPGLKRAAFELLGFELAKDRRVTCSDWSSKELTAEQVRYAGLDAWVTLRLYTAMNGM